MPRGNPNIKNIGKKFSSEYQPATYRQPTKMLTDLIVKNLEAKKEVILTGIDIISGEKRKFKIEVPTKEDLVSMLLNQAASGNIIAMKEILDRVEGKAVVKAEVDLPGVQFVGFKEE